MAPRAVVLYARDKIEKMVDAGHLIIIFKGSVLKLDNWARYHPGGVLPILHMVGKDATDPLSVYHSQEVVQQMSKFAIGRLADPEAFVDVEPPISRTSAPSAIPILATPIGDLGQPPLSQSATPNVAEWLATRSVAARWLKIIDGVKDDASKQCQDEMRQTLHQHELDVDSSEYPAVDAATQRSISDSFQALHETVREQGLYTVKPIRYAKELLRYSALFGSFVFAFRSGWFLTSAVCLGLFWHQIMFTAHDAGHLAITHNFKIDTAIGIFIADFCCGLSMGWWKSSHNSHHLVPNHPEHDPDIQNVPLFATSSTFFNSLRSSYYGTIFHWDAAAAVMVQLQQYTYYPVMCLARFNLYFLSWGYLISDKAGRLPASTWTRPLELFGMVCYWYWFGYCIVWSSLPTWPIRVAFVLISHITTMPLHVQITLSHWGMSTADLGCMESFAQKQLRTTMDVDCPRWLDFIHGGLQFQAVHHLFPRIPRHNLREAQKLVRKFCDEMDLKYTIFSFVQGNQVVLGRLREITKQMHILAQ